MKALSLVLWMLFVITVSYFGYSFNLLTKSDGVMNVYNPDYQSSTIVSGLLAILFAVFAFIAGKDRQN